MEKNHQKETEFLLTRTFNVPRERIFQAFSEGGHLAKWWGPEGFKVTSPQFEFKPGGIFHYCMEDKHGNKMWGRFIFQEIIAPEQIVFVNSFSDEHAGITRAPFDDTWPLEMLNTVTLADEGETTLLTLKVSAFNASEEEVMTFTEGFESMKLGFGATFDNLERILY